jgi:ribosomal protein S18 acetylase RimI-like enzyme
MISLREVTDDDYAFMRHLYGGIRAAEMAHFPFTQDDWERFLDQQFDAQSVYYLEHYPGADRMIVEEDGSAIGRFYVDRREQEIRIMDIALVESARNRGIGTRFIRRVLEEGASSGRRVTIHVEAYNPALRLYQRLGFRPVQTNGVYHLMEWLPEGGSSGVAPEIR